MDALRGAAVVWMVVFHLCFDLNYLGLIEPAQRFLMDPFWTVQRAAIVSLFVLCAGLGQAVALQRGREGGRFGRRFFGRWAQVAGCAVLVSAGSALMFPASWIHFGVLHGVAVMLLLLRWVAPLGRGVWVLAVLAFLLPIFVQHAVFNPPWLDWTGLVTRKPRTEDWVPVLPWFGVMLLGLSVGRWLLAHRPQVLEGDVPAALRPLAVLGRWSLSIYMLHQPLLIGALMAYVHWAR